MWGVLFWGLRKLYIKWFIDWFINTTRLWGSWLGFWLTVKTGCSRQHFRQAGVSDCTMTADKICNPCHNISGCRTLCFHFMQQGSNGMVSSWGKSVWHHWLQWSCADEHQWKCLAHQRNWKVQEASNHSWSQLCFSHSPITPTKQSSSLSQRATEYSPELHHIHRLLLVFPYVSFEVA